MVQSSRRNSNPKTSASRERLVNMLQENLHQGKFHSNLVDTDPNSTYARIKRLLSNLISYLLGQIDRQYALKHKIEWLIISALRFLLYKSLRNHSKAKFFNKGWGDLAKMENMREENVHELKMISRGGTSNKVDEHLDSTKMKWTKNIHEGRPDLASVYGRLLRCVGEFAPVGIFSTPGVKVHEGSCLSPMAEHFPEESKTVFFLLVTPEGEHEITFGKRDRDPDEEVPVFPGLDRINYSSSSSTNRNTNASDSSNNNGNDNSSSSSPRPPRLVILLPGTGEQGFGGRLSIAYKLAKPPYYYSCLLVCAPFYGRRRPPTQLLHFVEKVSDVIMQCNGVVKETALLVKYFEIVFEEQLRKKVIEEGSKIKQKNTAANDKLSGFSNDFNLKVQQEKIDSLLPKFCVSGFSWGAAM